MKIALVHDWLNQKAGGAEKVLEVLAAMYPEAPIYTLIFNPDKFEYDEGRIHTSRLQNMPNALKKRSRYLLPLIPNAIEEWDFHPYDIVISSSSAFAKNIVTPETTRHICYCHTPMRFVWDYWPQYIDEQHVGPLRRKYIRRQSGKLRIWDFVGAARVDAFIANSRTTRQRIQKFYRRKADVIHPPIDVDITTPDTKRDYYVTLGSLTPYKKLDLAIEAFNISGKHLKIIGDGPDRDRLESMAEDNIEFTGFMEADEKNTLLRQAKGLIFPQVEDFGIAPVEAMAVGTPVIAYNEGGATETVRHGQTGILFSEQTPGVINQAIADAEATRFNIAALHDQARTFSRQRFETAVRHYLEAYD